VVISAIRPVTMNPKFHPFRSLWPTSETTYLTLLVIRACAFENKQDMLSHGTGDDQWAR